MMRPHDGRIDHLYAALWALVLVQGPQHQFPDASQRPAPELPVHRRPLAEILVQITPGSTRARDPEYAVQHPSVILWRPTALPASRDHEWLKKRPLRVRHQTANQNCLPKSSLESHRRSVVNPLCQQDLGGCANVPSPNYVGKDADDSGVTVDDLVNHIQCELYNSKHFSDLADAEYQAQVTMTLKVDDNYGLSP